MHKRIIGFVTLVLLAAGASQALGQEQTERYIPIGQSPGISGIYAYLGAITGVDQSARTVTVQDEQGNARTIRIPDDARIWLDRSAQKETNLTGSFADLQVGRTIEVKYKDRERREEADWVKVAVVAGG